jgi:hypothetical protein
MVSIAEGLRMMQGGVDRTGFADMAESLGNPGLDLIAARRAEAAQAEAMDEYERRQAESNEEFRSEINRLIEGTQPQEKSDFSFGGAFNEYITNPILSGIDQINDAGKLTGSKISEGFDNVMDFMKFNPSTAVQAQIADAMMPYYEQEFDDLVEQGADPMGTALYLSKSETIPGLDLEMGMADGGRVGMQLGGGIMNNLLGNPQMQSMIQQYQQPTFNFSQVASPSIPQPSVAPATPPQAYTPFVSTMPLYDPSTLGTGLPSTAGMVDPYFVYDPYSPVGAFDAPPASTGPTPAGGFLSQKQIDETFKDLDKFTLAKQVEKAEAAKAKEETKKGGGGKENRDRFMANKNKNTSTNTSTKTSNKSAKHAGLKSSKAKGPNQGGSIHG